MELLIHLKFAYNRQEILAFLLINFFEITYTALLISSTFNHFYRDIFQIITFNGSFSIEFSIVLYIFNLLVIFLSMLGLISPKFKFIKSAIWPLIGTILKMIPYTFLVLVLNYEIRNIIKSQKIVSIICSGFNILMFVVYQFVHEFVNQTLKFKQLDYCNRRMISYPEQIIIIGSILSLNLMGNLYSAIFYLIRTFYIIINLYNNFQFQFSQRLQLFYALLYGYLSFSILLSQIGFINKSIFQPLSNTVFIIAGGIIVSLIFSNKLSVFIYQKFLNKTQWGTQLTQGDNITDNQQKILQVFENELKILVQVLIQRQRSLNKQPNQYDHFWKTFNERVFMHKLKCTEPKCICQRSKGKSNDETQEQIYIYDITKKVQNIEKVLVKQNRLKIININLLIQIAKKPLKGYYQLISIKPEKIGYDLKLQIEDLVNKSRECFDQIYYLNKVQNQQLNLMKVIECQQIMISLEQQILATITHTAAFLQLFTYNTAKISQVQSESSKLFELKKSIQLKLQKIVWQIGQNKMVVISMFIFYRILQVYRSRQAQFKKLCSQQDLKKRLLQKAEGQVVSEQSGIIYIDLVEQRGRIKKITKNISSFFGFSKDDMVGFNINLFMPTLFGKYHARFLSNFIDKGRIKLLKEKTRMVFGKNKEKFVFPISIKLKTQHLQRNEFGASALIGKIDTSSQFIIAGNLGKIQQITENLYKTVFGKSLKDEVSKINKLCIYKMILNLNQIIYDWQQKNANKIYEGLLIFPKTSEYFFEKFRHNRENSYSESVANTKSKTYSVQSNLSISHQEYGGNQEKFNYFTDLFQQFLNTINVSLLKAIKINFKYSKLKTAEFQVEIIQVISVREELQGEACFRQILNEIYNVTQTYDLNQQNSPLSNHLIALQNQIINKLDSRSLQAHDYSQNIMQKTNKYEEYKTQNEVLSYSDEIQDDQQKKLLVNHNNSQQSSLIGNNQNQSKKQLLINAFNSNQNTLSSLSLYITYLILFVLVILLVFIVYFSYAHYLLINQHWNQCFFLLKLQKTVEFRQSFVELDIFTHHKNISLSDQLIAQRVILNSKLSTLIQTINTQTVNKKSEVSPFSTMINLYDPIKNISYPSSYSQILTQLSWLYTNNNTLQTEFLKHNYEQLHKLLSSFYRNRQMELFDQNKRSLEIIRVFFIVYECLLGVITLCSLPLYFYFKRQELSIKNKLAYMNIKEIKRSMAKLKGLELFLKQSKLKGNLAHLQAELALKNDDRDDQGVNSIRSIKITSQSDDMKLFKNPILYIILLGFILLFSNLSISIYTLTQFNSEKFTAVVTANKLINNLEIKTPILLNIHLSNINRILDNKTIWTFSPQTIQQVSQGYFNLVGNLSSVNYNGNTLVDQIQSYATNKICQTSSQCNNSIINGSLNFIANSFKNRFQYWNPQNKIVMSTQTIINWIENNNIGQFLNEIYHIIVLSHVIDQKVELSFFKFISFNYMLNIILATVLIPLNALALFLIQRFFLNFLNQIIKNAEAIFMHFPVNILIENTYLTSYFNSKLKQGK